MLTGFYNLEPQLIIHIFSAIIAVLIGPFALYSRKRSRFHKWVGYTWISAMLITATTSFFISSFAIIGRFSPIHALSIITYIGIYQSLKYVYAGNILKHRKIMKIMYWYGLMIAGAANFLPNRKVNIWLFGDQPSLGYIVILVVIVTYAFFILRNKNVAQSQIPQ